MGFQSGAFFLTLRSFPIDKSLIISARVQHLTVLSPQIPSAWMPPTPVMLTCGCQKHNGQWRALRKQPKRSMRILDLWLVLPRHKVKEALRILLGLSLRSRSGSQITVPTSTLSIVTTMHNGNLKRYIFPSSSPWHASSLTSLDQTLPSIINKSNHVRCH
jgi:hypothetical protein